MIRCPIQRSVEVFPLQNHVLVFVIALAPAFAQTYRAPRNADNQPDLQGAWQAQTTASYDIQDHAGRLGMPPGLGIVVGGEIPYRPEALAKKKQNFQNRASADPNNKCFLPGVPRANYMPFPFQIFQTAKNVAILYEYVHAYRLIPLDGSKHPDDIDFWMGDSRGHREVTRWWGTFPTITIKPGLTRPAISIATRCTSWNVIRAPARIPSATKPVSKIPKYSPDPEKSTSHSTAVLRKISNHGI